MSETNERPTMGHDGYLSQTGVAEFCDVSDRTVRNWERDALIVGHRVRGVKLYRKADVVKMVEAGVEKGGQH